MTNRLCSSAAAADQYAEKLTTSTVRADVGIGPYGALLHLFVGRDAHIAPSNNALFSTVDIVSGSGAKRKSIRHTKRKQPCSANAW